MRRFYARAGAAASAGGWSVKLDDRPVRTPAKTLLVVPSRALATAVAGEWEAQAGRIDPTSMPLMQLSATAIDRTARDRERVIDEISNYGSTDLVCYRAPQPLDLAQRQEEQWQPLLEWVRNRYDVGLEVTTGLMAVRQPDRSIESLRRIVAAADDFSLTALATLTGAAGSLVVALALAEGRLDAEEAAEAALLEETFQAEKWGLDPEVERRNQSVRSDLAAGARFLELLREPD
jgi:chaperone required for assembly of F1-ATPase